MAKPSRRHEHFRERPVAPKTVLRKAFRLGRLQLSNDAKGGGATKIGGKSAMGSKRNLGSDTPQRAYLGAAWSRPFDRPSRVESGQRLLASSCAVVRGKGGPYGGRSYDEHRTEPFSELPDSESDSRNRKRNGEIHPHREHQRSSQIRASDATPQSCWEQCLQRVGNGTGRWGSISTFASSPVSAHGRAPPFRNQFYLITFPASPLPARLAKSLGGKQCCRDAT